MVTSGLRQASEGVKEYLIDQGQYSTSPTVHEVPSVIISPSINQSFFGLYINQSFFGPSIIQSFSCESHLDDVSALIVPQTLKVSKECSIDAESIQRRVPCVPQCQMGTPLKCITLYSYYMLQIHDILWDSVQAYNEAT